MNTELIEINSQVATLDALGVAIYRKFSDYETSLFRLNDPVQRQTVFCGFLKRFFLSQAIYQVSSIYFRQEIPEALLKQLNVSNNDFLFDGVICTISQEIHVFKIFLKNNREIVDAVDVGNFFTESLTCDYRFIITNANEISVNFEHGYSIRGINFDELSSQELEQLIDPARTHQISFLVKPRSHQLLALETIKNGFASHDRLTSVMACGSGKTLLSLWLFESMQVRSAIIFLPTLGLVEQTLREWLKNTVIKNFRYLCVCSDRTIAKVSDDLNYQQSELDFVVTTDPTQIRKFFDLQLKDPDAIYVIFSTYQSSAMVAAGMHPQDQFDLGIFDEAHKTVGDADKTFSFPLLNEQLKIKKRLFLTATPRVIHYQNLSYQAYPENRYSMDNKRIYGPQIFTFNFSDAVSAKIITDCKVIISVVTSDMVNKVIHDSCLQLEGSHVDTLMIAHSLAIEHAARENRVKRIITFHSRIESAYNFSKLNHNNPYGLLTDFEHYHINGNMSSAVRTQTLNEFSQATYAILTNARCLTEGIDVPAVDMIAFLSPRKSCVDIVQAAGRAMRQAENKQYGYVLIPVYIPMESSLPTESLINATDFDDVWRVLKALTEHDTLLQDEIRLGQEYRGEFGSHLARAIESSKIQIISPSNFDISSLREGIKTRCLEKVGDYWDFMYGQLRYFKKQYGHLNVNKRSEQWKDLGAWVGRNRMYYKKNILPLDKIKKLESLEFVWDPKEAQWLAQYDILCQYHRQFGHCNVPNHDKIWSALSYWLNDNRKNYRRNKLLTERIKKLEALGIVWNPNEDQWLERCQLLEQCYKKLGHCNISKNNKEWGRLGLWIVESKMLYRKGLLSKDRIEKFESYGIIWNSKDGLWLEQYALLKKFRQEYGHINIIDTDAVYHKLGKWLMTNRVSYNKNKLSKERIEKLESLGIIWDVYEMRWLEQYELLKKYQQEMKNVNVPLIDKKWGNLGSWLMTNRRLNRLAKLPKERIEKLELLGVIWNPKKDLWVKRYELIEEFYRKHGHINPIDMDDEMSCKLIKWLSSIRRLYRSGKLSKDHIEKLESFGICWNVHEGKWLQNYNRLIEYYKKFGPCNVSTGDIEWGNLGVWMVSNRSNYRQGKLSSGRIEKLKALGVILAE